MTTTTLAAKGRNVRLSLIVGSAVAAIALAVGATAWACTLSHQGTVWFCPTTNSSCGSGTSQTGLTGGAAKYSSGSGAVKNTGYTIQYSATDCMTGTAMNTVTSDNSGNWSGVSVTLPSGTGTYEECGVHDSMTVTNHAAFSIA